MVLAYLVVKTVNDAKTDRALAEQGIVSPRLTAKYGDAAKETTARYGLVDYLRDAWSDNWQQRTERRRAAVDAADAAEPTGGRSRVRWRDRIAAAKRAIAAGVEKAGPVVRKLVDPVPDRRTATADPDPAPVTPDPVSGPVCPECGATLTRSTAGWDHPDGSSCTATNQPHRRSSTNHRRPDPDAGRCPQCRTETERQSCPAYFPYCNRCGWARQKQADNTSKPEGDKPMTAPTGEAVNYETTVAELEAIAAEQRRQIDAAAACLKSVENAKSHIDGMQDAARTAAEASASVNDHLAALHLDSETLGHVGTAADALPASTVDRLLAQLEEVEATAREYLAGAEAALAATEAALAAVVAKYGDAHATVQGDLGGDARFLDGGAGATSAPVSAGV